MDLVGDIANPSEKRLEFVGMMKCSNVWKNNHNMFRTTNQPRSVTKNRDDQKWFLGHRDGERSAASATMEGVPNYWTWHAQIMWNNVITYYLFILWGIPKDCEFCEKTCNRSWRISHRKMEYDGTRFFFCPRRSFLFSSVRLDYQHQPLKSPFHPSIH